MGRRLYKQLQSNRRFVQRRDGSEGQRGRLRGNAKADTGLRSKCYAESILQRQVPFQEIRRYHRRGDRIAQC